MVPSQTYVSLTGVKRETKAQSRNLMLEVRTTQGGAAGDTDGAGERKERAPTSEGSVGMQGAAPGTRPIRLYILIQMLGLAHVALLLALHQGPPTYFIFSARCSVFSRMACDSWDTGFSIRLSKITWKDLV